MGLSEPGLFAFAKKVNRVASGLFHVFSVEVGSNASSLKGGC